MPTLDSDDPILRRATEAHDVATDGMWSFFALMAVIALALLFFSPADKSVQTASRAPAAATTAPLAAPTASPSQIR
jgi:hypothetical protein